MVIDLIGVLQDGSTHDDLRVPRNNRTPIVIVQGSSLVARMVVVTSAGMAVDLADPLATVQLTVKQTPQSSDSKIQVTGVPQPALGKNATLFTVDPATTKQLEPGLYVYDVWLTSSAGRECLIAVTQFHVMAGLRLP